MDESNGYDGDGANKRRPRVQRACDSCRKRKIRCDGLQPDKGSCSNCASYGHQCTFVDAAKRRAPPRSYVIALEARMERAERLISQLLPNVDINKAIGHMPELPSEAKKEGEEGEEGEGADQMDSMTTAFTSAHHAESSEVSNKTAETLESSSCYDSYDEEGEDAAFVRVKMQTVSLLDESESWIASFKNNTGTEVYDIALEEQKQLDRLSANEKGQETPLFFYGQASGVHVFPHLSRIVRQDDSCPSSLNPDSVKYSGPSLADIGLPAEDQLDWNSLSFRWPDAATEQKLLSIYFERVNVHHPVVNKVIFLRNLQKKDWKKNDRETALTALGVFALASRYLTAEESEANPKFPAMGEHWATLHHNLLVRNALPLSPNLSYIQSMVLSLLYLYSDPMPRSTIMWIMLAVIIRLLQDMGAHRRFTATNSNFSLVTAETYKRLWWVSYNLDRLLSADFGRPVLIQDEDVDIEDILLVDDEYIVSASENGTEPEQPADRPSVYHGFLQVVRLSHIIGRTLRTIYAISKSKAARGFVGQKWDAYIVAEIDKSLNRWLDQVPAHLAYSPLESNTDWLVQSSRIFLLYYYTQALVHRPFVQRYKLDSALTFHSLAIVSNASRSGIHVIHNLVQRGCATLIGPEVPIRLFVFGSYLLLISFSAVQKRFSVSSALLADTRKAVIAMHAIERTWRSARRMAIHLNSLVERVNLPAEGSHDSSVLKRGLEENTHQTPSVLSQGPPYSEQQREIRGMRNASSASGTRPTDLVDRKMSDPRLPLSTSELQGPFKDSPGSAFDQVAALSGWSREKDVDANELANLPYASAMPRAPAIASNVDGNGYSRVMVNGIGVPSQGMNGIQATSMAPNGLPVTQPPMFGLPNSELMNLVASGLPQQSYPAYTRDGQLGEDRADRGTMKDGFPMMAAGESSFVPGMRPTLDANGEQGLRNDPFLGGAPPLPTPSFDFATTTATPTLESMSNDGQQPALSGENAAGFWPPSSSSQQPANGVAAYSSDPLDALSNLNGFWSDSDWMRALQGN